MRQKIARGAEKFINFEIIALAFLLPIFFLPITTEFFEFNKLAILSVAVILGLSAWALKAALTGSLGVRHSPLDLPVVLLWLVAAVATVFSENRLLSMIGQYARWHPSLFSVTILTGFYFLASWNLNKKALQAVFWALLASAGIAAVLFVPQYFGANLFGQAWSARATFNLTGSLTMLALILGAVSGLVLKWFVTPQKISGKVASTILLIFTAVVLTFINTPAGWVALGASILVSLLTAPAEFIRKNRAPLLRVFVIAVVIGGTILIPPLFAKTTFLNRSLPKEISLDLQTSWSVAATSFRQQPVWGSGPSTFLSDFTRYKPLRFNQSAYWTLRFEKPLNEYLRAFAEEGLLGVLAWFVLLGTLVKTLFKSKERGILPVAAAILVSFFLTPATVLSSFLLFLSLASISAKDTEEVGKENRPVQKWMIVLLGLVVIPSVLGLGWVYRAYAAEVAHRRSFTTQQGLEAYNYQVKAARKFPWRAEYHLSLAQTNFSLANQLSTKKDPTETEQESIGIFVSQSISEARRATELYPLNVINWESLAQVYRALVGLAADSGRLAVDSYQRAVALDLFNPLLRTNFGGLYYQLGQFDLAAEQFRAAANFKPDYPNAHYNLGRTYKELGKKDLAIAELETALRLSGPNVQGYEEAKKILDELKAQ